MRHADPVRVVLSSVVIAGLAGCSRQPPAPDPSLPREAASTVSPVSRAEAAPSDAGDTTLAVVDAGDERDRDPMATHVMTQPELLKLVPMPAATSDKAAAHRDQLLSFLIAPAPGHFNQGNVALAHHTISRAACLAGLHDVVLQTDEQRAICNGAENMVPIYSNGDPHSAKTCIDIFEFPNQPCELPFVWGTPNEAETTCELQGKRLCSQSEWNLACSADPAGKEKWPYAYGDKLDLTLCNTNVPHQAGPDGKAWRCSAHDAKSAWASCSTDTEPVGAFPKCKSRLGVFDQHGNVAEEMTRAEEGVILTQLKGSAFFYVDVAREPGKAALHPERESYVDTCNYDPRWHVEELKKSLHINYHLGFRCCKGL